MKGSPHKELSRAKKLLENGEFENAFKLAESLEEEKEFIKEENAPLLIEVLIVKAHASWRLGKLDQGLKSVEKGERLLLEVKKTGKMSEEIESHKGDLLHHGGILYWYRGDLDRALKYHQRGLLIREKLGNRKGIANSYNNLGLVYWSKGDLNQAMEYHQRSYSISEELGDKRSMAISLSNLGNVYARKGDLEKALECQKRSLALKEDLGAKHDIVLSHINIGVVYQFQGNLDQALTHYQRSLALGEEIDSKRDIALAINNLGNIHQLKGDLEQALKDFQRSLAIYKELGIKEKIALLFGNIGDVFRRKGEFDKSLDYYQQSLGLYEELGNDPSAAVILFELMWVAIEQEALPLAQQYIQKLQEINERTDNRVIDQRYRVAQALLLKASKRTRHKLKAAGILEQVVNEEVGDHSLTVTAMIHLSDLLLSELKMTGEDELFGEIKALTDRLLEIAVQQSSYSLLAETYFLQSKLALIELDLGLARKLLDKAYGISQEKDLHILEQSIRIERDSLQSQLERWKSVIRKNPSRQEMITLTKTDDFLEHMIQQTVANLFDERATAVQDLPKKYQLVYLDLLKDSQKTEKQKFRVGVAQMGLSQTGDILQELYQEQAPGLFALRENQVKSIRSKVNRMVDEASSKDVNILIFPELAIDLNHKPLLEDILGLAKTHKMYIIPGSFHNPKTKQNLSRLVSPEGILWEQEKHIPAIIRLGKKRIEEGIRPKTKPQTTYVGNTEYGRIAIVICRDFLDMDLRVEIKNSEPPIDILINPSFTPVTADFKAAHFDARRSIYAYSFFVNIAEFGNSIIYSPEKERVERTIQPKEESLIYKDVDLFKLRSERKKWELEQKKKQPFIQSTR